MDPESLKDRYRGDTAVNYEDDRKESEKWNNEQEAVKRYLHRVATTSDSEPTIVDVPVGTGRFFDVYTELGADVLGVDVSEDMIEEARRNASDDDDVELTQGDIFELGEFDVEPAVVVCVRLLNWFELEDFSEAIDNVADADPEFAIVSVRTYPSAGDRTGTTGPVRTVRSAASLGRRAVQILGTEGPKAVVDSASSFLRRKTGAVPTITVHDKDAVFSVFEERGFDVVDRTLVDEGDDGSEYHIYLLEST